MCCDDVTCGDLTLKFETLTEENIDSFNLHIFFFCQLFGKNISTLGRSEVCYDVLINADVSSLQGLTGPIGEPGPDGPPGQKVSD